MEFGHFRQTSVDEVTNPQYKFNPFVVPHGFNPFRLPAYTWALAMPSGELEALQCSGNQFLRANGVQHGHNTAGKPTSPCQTLISTRPSDHWLTNSSGYGESS